MKVSVLTPTLDAERHLPECLRSLRAQTLPAHRIEHIVLDGLSTDRTVELARASGARVEVERDGSLYAALNKGIRLASGDVVAWLNADDTFRPDALERVCAAFEANPEAELVVGDYEIVRGGRSTIVRGDPGALDRIRDGQRGRAWVIPLATFFRTRTLRELGEYPVRYRIAADLDVWLRAAARDPRIRVAHMGSVAGTFLMHEGSLSSGTSPEKSLRELVAISEAWYRSSTTPRGVKRFARYLYRRNAWELTAWEVRERPRWRKALAGALCLAKLSLLGPGAMQDFRTEFW